MKTSKLAAITRSERRFDGGAWLTIAFVLLLSLWQVSDAVLSLAQPSDGWSYNSTNELVNRPRFHLVDTPTPLRDGDRVIAIDGRSWDPLLPPPLPERVFVGQVLRYTIQRDGLTFDADVTLIDRPLRSIGIGLIASASRDPFSWLSYIAGFLVAMAVFALRPANRAARYMLVVASVLGIEQLGLSGGLGPYLWRAPTGFILALALGGASWSMVFFPSLTLLALSFPKLKAPLRRFPRALPAFVYGLPTALILPGIIQGAASRSLVLLSSSPLVFLSFFASLVTFAVALVASMAHSLIKEKDPVALAQLRWAAVGLGGSYGTLVAAFMLTTAFGIGADDRTQILNYVGLLGILFPISIAIAILRYRLFDIDVIIRRTLVYGLLSALLAGIYFGSVALLQTMITAFTGQARSELVTVVSTLAIAGLVLPLRNGLQKIIDRRFYRRKFNAEQALARFSAEMRDAVEMDAISAHLMDAVEETMQPERIQVWIAGPRKSIPEAQS